MTEYTAQVAQDRAAYIDARVRQRSDYIADRLDAARVVDIAMTTVALGVVESGGENNGVPRWLFMSGEQLPWCAAFVLWVFKRADCQICGDQFAQRSCQTLWVCGQERGETFDALSGTVPGDIIFFGKPTKNHCGIVVRADADQIIVAEGNSGDRAALRSYKPSDPNISGYMRPYHEEDTLR